MSKNDVQNQLAIEEQKLMELTNELQKTESTYLSEYERYCNSGDGSEEQERRRDEHMERMQEKRDRASVAVDAQRQLINTLQIQLQE